VLAAGFGSIILLTILFGLDTWRRTSQIYSSVLEIHQSHLRTEAALRHIESGIYLSGLFIRDFLLDPSQITAALHRRELLEVRESMEQNLDILDRTAAPAIRDTLHRLREENEAYWASLDPVFEWTPQRKMAMSSLFLRRQVLPRRNAVLAMAEQIQALTADDLRQRQEEVDASMDRFRETAERTLIVVLVLALAVAMGSTYQIWRLEGKADKQRVRTEHAERELRLLSQKLVRAQEEERRHIARELHDEIGQMLTALKVELGNLDRLRNSRDEEYRAHLDDAKQLATQTLVSVRTMASGLRPSVLDDLGLGPALQWQAREFSRRTGVPVEVSLEDLPADLPDAHRTCIYRVVQEALTNCARHSEAGHIDIDVHREDSILVLKVQDNGRGLPNGGGSAAGLGLRGMEERVRELGGYFRIESDPGGGTTVKASIPLPAEVAA
jgi:signal transduction histidine kinase